ncbi:oxidoreductase [Aliigemmobacter aestuarii]|uniref:Oxidoreductase n=1 Tax=Aliigemmobacter aestuarii TaxID=1445661 RepID=A0A4S3MK32_9RHOB|nr:molybdopterin-dependent oxidoreductase [Gemmobacter aestuarii]THD82312.1 oxidoreductase [Gemmobacter aestuarii]
MNLVARPASVRRICLWSLRYVVVAAITAAALSGTPVRADGFDAPTGRVILTVSGNIEKTNENGVLALDQTLLETLPQHEFSTSTIWTEGVITFRGVLLRDLLQAVGSNGGTVVLTALNDYRISVPVADATGAGPMVAYLMNGAPMPVRDKGPIWLVYPYDADPAFRTEQTYARSIWQLDRIEVLD